jgi:DNA polymerase-3 subunit delta
VSQPVYLLVGETFLAEEAIERIRAEEGTDPLSEVVFEPGADTTDLINALETRSLLGGKRLVVLRDAKDLRKEQAQALAAYLDSPSPDSVFVILASGRSKLDAAAKQAGAVITLETPKGRRLVAWLRSRATERELKVDERAGWALIDSVGADLRELDGALVQLATALGAGATVGVGQVNEIFKRRADERIFAFTDAVGMRRLTEAMTALRRLLEQGDEPLMIFGALSGHIRRLLAARRLADKGPQAVGEEMGLPSWRAERLARQARSYREEELISALGVLAQTDVDLKGEAPEPGAVLEVAVARIITGSGVSRHPRLTLAQ